MRVGTFIMGSLVGAATVMYVNRVSKSNSTMTDTSMNSGGVFFQRIMEFLSTTKVNIPASNSHPQDTDQNRYTIPNHADSQSQSTTNENPKQTHEYVSSTS
jgi:hypothetical protein